MTIELRLLDWAGTELKALPDVESLTLSPVLCDAGAIEFSYPKSGANWQFIATLDEFPVAVYIDGVKQGNLQGVVKEVDGDDVSESSVWKYTGFFNNGRLAEAETYPAGWPSFDPVEPNQKYLSITVGSLVKTLLQQAQARGTLTGFTHASFNSTTDSLGASWSSLVSIEYAPQVDYLTILKNLYVQGLCEFEVVGTDIRLYKPNTLSVDRTLGTTPLVFRGGRDLVDSPRKRSTRDVGTVMLASGADGLYVERVDSAQVASRRRIETSASQGQVSDQGTLILYADAQLSRVSTAKMEKTHGLVFGDSASPRPIRDFNVGDWAFSDVSQGLERLRIKQWTLSLNAAGELTGSVSLNDLFAERNELLSRRIEGIIGGSTITGGSAAERDLPANVVDQIAPAAPTGLALSSTAYVDNQGQTFANVAATWVQVTTNSDGTILEDLGNYVVRWRYAVAAGQPVEAWRYHTAGTDARTTWSPVSPGLAVEAQVQAVDRVGNASAFQPTVPVTITAGTDVTPPGVPSTPIMDNYLGLLRIRYDGKTASGAALAPDIQSIEVHVSTTSNFTPDRTATSTTRIDTISPFVQGVSYHEGLYATAYFAKFVAVDQSKNASAASAQATATPSQVVDLDVFDGAIGTAKLADLAVTTAKINNLAVNDAKIGSLSVGKLTAGTMSVDVVLGGRFTTALTGLRVEMNALGFQKFAADNSKLISLTGSEALLTGIFKTASTGRRIEIGSGGGVGRVEFYAPDNTVSEIGSFTGANVNVEALRMGIRDDTVSQFWKKIQVQEDGTINTWSAGNKITVGGNGTEAFKGFQVTYASTRGTPADPNIPDQIREWITSTANDHYIPPNGNFRISEYETNGVASPRMYINGTDWTYYDTTGKLRHWVSPDATYIRGKDDLIRVEILDTLMRFWPQRSAASPGRLEIIGPVGTPDSAILKFITQQFGNGFQYGGCVKFWINSADLSNGHMEIRNLDNSNFERLWASSFEVNSDRVGKSGIEDLERSATDILKNARPRRFRRKREDGLENPLEYGLVTDEAPPELVSGDTSAGYSAINLYSFITLLLAQSKEFLARLEALERKGKK